jgi:hypothetical protein
MIEPDAYVHQQNLELYRKLLVELPADDSRRVLLTKLLAAEKAKARPDAARSNSFRVSKVATGPSQKST